MMRIWIVICVSLWCSTALAQSLTLSPAVVPLGGRGGQSTQQHLTLSNGTNETLDFKLVAKDVVVRNGARQFVEAGELKGGIAASAKFSTRNVRLLPGQERSVDVTLTLPAKPSARAVVILFQGTTKLRGSTTVSIGSLLTFDLAGRTSIDAGELKATPPTRSTDATFSLAVSNDGDEPAIVRTAIAIIGPNGAIVGKRALEGRRLLPGERTTLSTDYFGVLASGSYRIAATIEANKKSWTRSIELVVP